jgi:hypothetical protein
MLLLLIEPLVSSNPLFGGHFLHKLPHELEGDLIPFFKADTAFADV